MYVYCNMTIYTLIPSISTVSEEFEIHFQHYKLTGVNTETFTDTYSTVSFSPFVIPVY